MLSRIGLVALSIALTILFLELGLRAFHTGGSLTGWNNYVLAARGVLTRTEGARFEHHPELGHVPRGGARGNGEPRSQSDAAPILAVGDSYTYGEEVDDHQTWPAQLERRLGRPVLNGGVSGYGLDQIVLRAEQLARGVVARGAKPAAIIVSFIADDVPRTEMRRLWGGEKPYFDIHFNKLALRNVPVPPRPDPKTTLTFWQRTLGHSFLFDFAMRRLGLLHNWFGDHVRMHESGHGAAISCRLMERLAALQKETGAPILVLAQYEPWIWHEAARFGSEPWRLTQGVLVCATNYGLATVDSFRRVEARVAEGSRLYGLWHMNDAGNRLTADILAEALSARRLN
jgi:hypothetical protein